MICLILLYINGTTFFLKGFLLTRKESLVKSSFNDGISCCLTPKYKKVIIFVIDALRYDFIFYDKDATQIYRNNMPFIAKLLDGSSASLYQVLLQL